MALVTYVDILEVVGTLDDFRNRLAEGENIANSSSITDVNITARDHGWEVSAKCRPQSGDDSSAPLSINIFTISEPRYLHCSCSCNSYDNGKCKHVIATLIYLHRNNAVAPEIKKFSKREVKSLSSRQSTPTEENQPNKRLSLRSSKKLNKDVPVLRTIGEVNEAVKAGRRGPESIKSVSQHKSDIKDGSNTSVVTLSERISSDTEHVGNADVDIRGDIVSSGENLCPSTDEKKEPLVKRQTKRKFPGNKESVGSDAECNTGPKRPKKKVIARTLSAEQKVPNDASIDATGSVPNGQPSPEPEIQQVNYEAGFIPPTFPCTICGKGYRWQRSLELHRRVHRDEINKRKNPENVKEKRFQCTKCGKCFNRKRSFNAHFGCEGESNPESQPAPKIRAKRRVVAKCEVCGKEFSNRMHHEEHMRSHTGERPFQCVECGKGFASKRSLKNHSHEGPGARERPYLCSQCPAKFATAFMLKTHSRTHTDEKPWVCSECGKAYRSQHVLLDHQNQHRGIKAHMCKECGKKFTWRTSLWAHTRDHSRAKPHECVQCGAMFAEQHELKEHWEEHADDKPFQCSECGLGFLRETDREKHMETHNKEASFVCAVCNEKFTRADLLAQHNHIHKEPKTCLCPNCGKTFSNKGHLKVHMLIHSGEKPFECETCQKRFYTRSLLRKHAVFHSNERPFVCSLCHDCFPTQGILQAHLRTHTGEKPYVCSICERSFTQSTYLKRHSLLHSGERPHPCSLCDTAFISRYDLKIHMRIHTGEKPFSCEECEESFYERSALTIHQRVHTGEQPFRCDQCNKGFNSSNHVKKHFARLHPDVAPFPCDMCEERFGMCETLRKHKRRIHNVGNAYGRLRPSAVMKKAPPPKDTLNQLIKDSQILQDDIPIPETVPLHIPIPAGGYPATGLTILGVVTTDVDTNSAHLAIKLDPVSASNSAPPDGVVFHFESGEPAVFQATLTPVQTDVTTCQSIITEIPITQVSKHNST